MTAVLKHQVFCKEQRQKRNYLIHLLYVRKDFGECLKLVEDTLEQVNGLAEYPLYIKGLIKRHQGCIQESLKLFQAATILRSSVSVNPTSIYSPKQAGRSFFLPVRSSVSVNSANVDSPKHVGCSLFLPVRSSVAVNPTNVSNLKQVGRSLFLLGKHKGALEVYEEALRLGNTEDWEVWHNQGLCLNYLKKSEEAKEAFMRANSVQRHDSTFLQLGQIFTQQEDYKSAIDVYLEALEFSPENPEILTTIGLLYLRLGENFRAFDFLGNSLTHDPKNPKTILAAGSIIQDHSDMDVALIKYRVAAVQTPNSAQLWNNIGMCFFGKQRYVAAIACLKKALYLDPFEWIISYNLGLVHLNTGQHASAFHYFSASINLKPDFPSSYMHLGITLARLNDFDNSCSAYEKAIEMDNDYLFHLNYAIMLTNNEDISKARKHLQAFEELFEELDAESKAADADVAEQRELLRVALK